LIIFIGKTNEFFEIHKFINKMYTSTKQQQIFCRVKNCQKSHPQIDGDSK
jgi:hypothetical protein